MDTVDVRADRLVAKLLLLLQARGRVTAAELGRDVEVSERTARRDLEALAMAGLPVYSERGRGGGWRLLGGGRTDLSGLTADEARAMLLLAGPTSRVTPQGRTILRKLVQALPQPFRKEAETAASAVAVDPDRWGALATSSSQFVQELQRAIIERRIVRITYERGSQGAAKREVHPLGLVAKGGIWYFVAATSGGQRTYRVSRIRSVEITEHRANRPDGFDLDGAWRSIAETIEGRRTVVHAFARASAEALDGLRMQFGRDVEVVRSTGDEHLVSIGGNSARVLAERLAGWGTAIDVVGPTAVRRHLADIGQELVAAHAEVLSPGLRGAQPDNRNRGRIEER
jgi:predicted DNA-binding transcriptional regulator YafY